MEDHLRESTDADKLRARLGDDGAAKDNGTRVIHRLSNAGLFEAYVSGAIGSGGVHYQITPLGQSFLAVTK